MILDQRSHLKVIAGDYPHFEYLSWFRKKKILFRTSAISKSDVAAIRRICAKITYSYII